eukprot:CAMPEP_0118719958 /NCGR_PEP_ID=MMETSP0800-20121206/29824_1 /TAXON_ID=210618 ORGANISM="Striatella unipunctata, Strain CCMP2910" /NCGR_SAMPLE_ID=MMETSP0800 /ASSEMBLY_ACC=CAM_ASM_000638 /LENGTH=234 /DNA_ID=CAMNT_0006627505 /DNA_START=208 /DNA_END=913 /DNA_ORIENTATION=-
MAQVDTDDCGGSLGESQYDEDDQAPLERPRTPMPTLDEDGAGGSQREDSKNSGPVNPLKDQSSAHGRTSPGGTVYKGRGVRRYQGRYMHLPLIRFEQGGVSTEDVLPPSPPDHHPPDSPRHRHHHHHRRYHHDTRPGDTYDEDHRRGADRRSRRSPREDERNEDVGPGVAAVAGVVAEVEVLEDPTDDGEEEEAVRHNIIEEDEAERTTEGGTTEVGNGTTEAGGINLVLIEQM